MNVRKVVILFLFIPFLSCSKQATKEINEQSNLKETDIDSIFSLKKDSLYAELIQKVNYDSIYVPVIRYILNELNPENTHFRDTVLS